MLTDIVTKFIKENWIFCAIIGGLMLVGLVNSFTKKKKH